MTLIMVIIVMGPVAIYGQQAQVYNNALNLEVYLSRDGDLLNGIYPVILEVHAFSETSSPNMIWGPKSFENQRFVDGHTVLKFGDSETRLEG